LSAVAKATGALDGKTFVFTGALKKYSRSEAGGKVENLGGRVGSNLTKKTDFIVVGEDPGSKVKEAEKLGVVILIEGDFLKLIGE
jgi:DNA ligase (NAD+)